ncbi:MAG: hypothetical protein RSB29_01520 [Alistipes sp.]
MEITNTMERSNYTMPSIEIIHLQVEQGFAESIATTELMTEEEITTF